MELNPNTNTGWGCIALHCIACHCIALRQATQAGSIGRLGVDFDLDFDFDFNSDFCSSRLGFKSNRTPTRAQQVNELNRLPRGLEYTQAEP
jgi:hypothetical protein